MSNKERIAEIEEILKVRNPKATLGLRKELGRLLEAEVEVPKEPTPVKIVKKVKKPKKS